MSLFPRSEIVYLPLIFAAAFGGGPAKADGVQEQALRWEQAECLRDNAASYLEANDFPSMLFIGLCPENPKPTAAELAEYSQNSALDLSSLPRLISGPRVPLDPHTAVVVLTRAQLLCLQNQFDSVAKPETTILSGGRKIRVAVLDFSICRQ
jgi:hypothetical protein